MKVNLKEMSRDERIEHYAEQSMSNTDRTAKNVAFFFWIHIIGIVGMIVFMIATSDYSSSEDDYSLEDYEVIVDTTEVTY